VTGVTTQPWLLALRPEAFAQPIVPASEGRPGMLACVAWPDRLIVKRSGTRSKRDNGIRSRVIRRNGECEFPFEMIE